MDIEDFKITVDDILYYKEKRIGLLKNQTGKYKTFFSHQQFDGLKLVSQTEYKFEEHIALVNKNGWPQVNLQLYQKIFDIISKEELV